VPVFEYFSSAAWDGSTTIVVGSGGAVLTSPDGSSWQNHTRGETPTFEAIAHGDPGFVATGYGSIFLSPDGSDWSRSGVRMAISSGQWRTATAASSPWPARTGFSRAPTPLLESPAALPMGRFSDGVAFGHGKFVAVGPHRILTSRDGIHWTRHATRKALTKVAWTGSMFVAVGYKGAILTSRDGAAWRSHPSGEPGIGGCLLRAPRGDCRGRNVILTSPDGSTWENARLWDDDMVDLLAVAQGNGTALAAGSGSPYLSRDGRSGPA